MFYMIMIYILKRQNSCIYFLRMDWKIKHARNLEKMNDSFLHIAKLSILAT